MIFFSNYKRNLIGNQQVSIRIGRPPSFPIALCPTSYGADADGSAALQPDGQRPGRSCQVVLGAIKLLSLALLLVSILTVAGTHAARGQTATTKIAILNVERIYREAAASRNLQQQLDEQRGISQGELRSEERALLEADQELNKLRPDLSNQVFTQKSRELAQQFGVLQRRAQRRRETLKQLFEQGTGQVQKILIAVVQDIANEQNLDLVLAAGSVVLQNPILDITDEAIVRLNARLPSLSLTSP